MSTGKKHEYKIYAANESCVFRKTKENFGGLSNMAAGFPLHVNNIKILSSEALYQACRFPELPDLQKKIITEKSPMTAKMVSKPFRKDSRQDWDDNRIKIMRWCLRIKLAQNYVEFGKILESTGNRPIVEDSTRDDFWGAIREKDDSNILKGVNALGRLLMELRQFYNEKRYSYDMFVVEPLNILNFKLFNENIERIDEREKFISYIKNAVLYNPIELNKVDSYPAQYKSIQINSMIVKEPEQLDFNTDDMGKDSGVKKKKDKYEGQGSLPF